MLKVTVEIYPYGNECNKETIGVMTIGNETPRQPEKARYSYKCIDQYDAVFHGTEVSHTRDEGFWKLLYLCLKDKFE